MNTGKRNGWEWALLGLILLVGGWLRFSHLELLEFKGDEAVAAHLALQFVRGGELPTAGLMSSVGVSNPPLFIYLLIPMFFLTTNVAMVSCMIGALGLCAVAMVWHVGRKYYGATVGLLAAAMFAVSPWAVIYSRKIWAQDFVPVLATVAMWATHALVLGKRSKAIFWVTLVPLCMIQIHYSGLAVTAAIVVILVLLRPKIDWRFAAAGVVVAVLLSIPYVVEQSRNGWVEFKRMAEQRSGRNWQIPKGMTIQPNSGYPLPRRPSEAWIHALSIINAGQIEDVLGLSADARFDPQRIVVGKSPGGQAAYFLSSLTLGGSFLQLQRLLMLGGVIFMVAIGVRELLGGKMRITSEQGQRAWILALWLVVPVIVYMVAGLWTYLSYYAILFPALFLATASWVTFPLKAVRVGSMGIIGLALLWNVVFATDLCRFLSQHGGAQGTYGSGLGFKRQAALFLSERSEIHQLMAEQRLLQMDQVGRVELPQMDLPFLMGLQSPAASKSGSLASNTVVLVVDMNRTNYDPQQVPQLAAATFEQFGPMRMYFLDR